MPLPRDLSTTTEAHIASLVAEQAVEGAHLEFKRELPARGGAGAHELAADVSAFANGAGGDIVYGIDEDGDAKASAIVPLTGNADEEARRVQDVLVNGVQPRMPGVQVRAVPVSGGFALVIRVPQSWAGPHRVSSNMNFYLREGARKRPLDVPEVRGLFLRSEHQAQRVRGFRTERLGKLLAGEAPHRLVPGALMVAHFVPTQAALGMAQVDPIPYMDDRALPVLGSSIAGARVNVDGALVVRNAGAQGTHGYSQFFRNGFFETVRVMPYAEGERAHLGSVVYEEDLIALLDKLRGEYLRLGIGPEMTCMLSLTDARRLQIGLDRWRYNLEDHQGFFDRDTIALPDVLLPAEVSAAQALKPIFDLVWQAAGLARSFNYDAAGAWAPLTQR